VVAASEKGRTAASERQIKGHSEGQEDRERRDASIVRREQDKKDITRQGPTKQDKTSYYVRKKRKRKKRKRGGRQLLVRMPSTQPRQLFPATRIPALRPSFLSTLRPAFLPFDPDSVSHMSSSRIPNPTDTSHGNESSDRTSKTIRMSSLQAHFPYSKEPRRNSETN
jgi:hypothetical protein